MLVPQHGIRFQDRVFCPLWLTGEPIVRFDEIGLYYGRERTRTLIFDSVILDFVTRRAAAINRSYKNEIRRWK